jgi:hypothetical protein
MQLNIALESRRQGPPVWSYRWRQAGPDGKLVRRRMIVGAFGNLIWPHRGRLIWPHLCHTNPFSSKPTDH